VKSYYETKKKLVIDPGSLTCLGNDGQDANALNAFAEPEAGLAAAAVALHSFACSSSSSKGCQMPDLLLLLGEYAQQGLQGFLPMMPLGLELGTAAAAADGYDDDDADMQPPTAALKQQQQQGAEGVMQPNAQQQQQQSGSAQCCFAQHDALSACVYWMHGERLAAVSAEQWPQFMAAAAAAAADAAAAAAGPDVHSRSSAGKRTSSSTSGGHPAAAAAVPGGCDVESLQLLADLNCDWCNGPMPSSSAATPAAAAAAETGCSVQQKARWGCASCSNAQYCSQACASAGNKVHGPNCW
jgi:hypothetical protein